MNDLLDNIAIKEREADFRSTFCDTRLSTLSRINIKSLRDFIERKIRTLTEAEKNEVLRNIYYEYAARCWAHDVHDSVPSSAIDTLDAVAHAVFEP